MSTKHVILALLDIQPMSGYDLVQNMKISLHSLWAATYSQIYPTLHKMEDEGWVKGRKTISQKGRERIEYSLTEMGRSQLHDWFEEPVHYLPYRDPFKLWATNIDRCSPASISRNAEEHIRLNEEREQIFLGIVAAIEDDSHPLIRERINQLSVERVEEIKKSRAIIFRMLAEQARFEIRCAKQILSLAYSLGKV